MERPSAEPTTPEGPAAKAEGELLPATSAPSAPQSVNPVPETAAPSSPAATLAESPLPIPASEPAPVDPGATLGLEATSFEERYATRTLLGSGGMGEVRLCRDNLIGREVAMKVVRPGTGSQPGLVPRFLQEARVQGQIDHPAVVPVYDLGLSPDRVAYFTMKRVRGVTLAQILHDLARGDPETEQRHSRRKLLTAFSSVCLAVHFAHRRGVVHRDLKPPNVMLGDFGEVYVLDWGLAKVAGQADTLREETPPLQTEIRTFDGSLMGTPGYMAPEQIRAGGAVDLRADVYALGAILFEILALEPLHPRAEGTAAIIASTLTGVDARPSARAPDRDVPPELDAICVRATGLDPAARFPSARAVHEAVERFLDGDRDLELRRRIADDHARAAEEAAVWARSGESFSLEHRRRALRDVGRALALDPGNARAVRTMVGLLLDPPREVPPDARAEMEASARTQIRLAARLGAVWYLLIFLFVPMFLWMGVRDWTLAAGFLAVAMTAIALSAVMSRQPEPSIALQFLVLALSTVAVAWTANMFGPFVLLPTLALANTIGFAMMPGRKTRAAFLAAGCLAIAVPAGLEWAGVVSPSYVFQDGLMAIVPGMHDLPETPTWIFLFTGNLALVVGGVLYVGKILDALGSAERRLQLHTWHLRQLLPEEARSNLARAKSSSRDFDDA